MDQLVGLPPYIAEKMKSQKSRCIAVLKLKGRLSHLLMFDTSLPNDMSGFNFACVLAKILILQL